MSRTLLRVLYAIVNLLGIVGVGTLLAGRVKTGIAQILISIAALALTILPLIQFFKLAIGSLSFHDVMEQTSHGNFTWQDELTQNLLHSGPGFQVALLSLLLASLAGVVIFFLNWAWSGITTTPVETAPPPLPPSPPS